VLDTTHFIGNAPGEARLSDDDSGTELLARTRLQPDTEHRFPIRSDATARSVRLDVYPDGGLARLRVFGEVPESARDEITTRWMGMLPPAVAASVDQAEFFA
jgi:allantoicase